MDKLNYSPSVFLVAHDSDWDRYGLYLLYVDFEDSFEVTGVRITLRDVSAAANNLRDVTVELRIYATCTRCVFKGHRLVK
jgi:hypothetical protein